MGSVLTSIQDKNLRKLGRQAILAGWEPLKMNNNHVRFQSPVDQSRYVVVPSTCYDGKSFDIIKSQFTRYGGLTPVPKVKVAVEAESFEKMVRQAPPPFPPRPDPVPEPPKPEPWEQYKKGLARERVVSFLRDHPGQRVAHDMLMRATKLESPRVSQAVTQAMKRDPKVKRIAKGVFEYQAEVLAPRHDVGRRAAITARVRRQARIAKAPRPGEAKTVDEVLGRGTSAGQTAGTRRRILEGIVALGGEFRDERGGASGKFLDAVLGADDHDFKPRSSLALLRRMVDEGMLGREGNSKRTFRVFLLDPLLLGGEAPDEPDPEEPTPAVQVVENPRVGHLLESVQRHPSVSNPVTPIAPYVGQQLIVMAAFTGFDGKVIVELRNGTKSWLCDVNAMRLLEEV